jgi:hypothetical protein
MNGNGFVKHNVLGIGVSIFDKLTNKQCNHPRQIFRDRLELGFVINKRWKVATCKF